MAIRALHLATHMNFLQCGFVLATAFCLAMLLALWNWILKADLSWQTFLALSLAAFFPGNVYFNAVFPVSMFLFFVLLSLRMLMQQQWFWCGLAGGVAAFTYSTGFLLAPITVLTIFVDHFVMHRQPLSAKRTDEIRDYAPSLIPRRPALFRPFLWAVETGGLISLGFLSVLGLQWRQVGRWNAFFLEQKAFHHRLTNPITTWLVETHPYIQGTLWPPRAYHAVAGLQSIFVLGLVVLFLVYSFHWRLGTLDLYLCIYLVGYWLLPLLAGGFVSLYRAEALLFPSAALSRHVPKSTLAVLTACSIVLTLGMDPLFFRAWLV